MVRSGGCSDPDGLSCVVVIFLLTISILLPALLWLFFFASSPVACHRGCLLKQTVLTLIEEQNL